VWNVKVNGGMVSTLRLWENEETAINKNSNNISILNCLT